MPLHKHVVEELEEAIRFHELKIEKATVQTQRDFHENWRKAIREAIDNGRLTQEARDSLTLRIEKLHPKAEQLKKSYEDWFAKIPKPEHIAREAEIREQAKPVTEILERIYNLERSLRS